MHIKNIVSQEKMWYSWWRNILKKSLVLKLILITEQRASVLKVIMDACDSLENFGSKEKVVRPTALDSLKTQEDMEWYELISVIYSVNTSLNMLK